MLYGDGREVEASETETLWAERHCHKESSGSLFIFGCMLIQSKHCHFITLRLSKAFWRTILKALDEEIIEACKLTEV